MANTTQNSQISKPQTKNANTNSSQQKPKFIKAISSGKNKESRNAKRRRWAKKHLAPKTAPKPVSQKPKFDYLSGCCSVPTKKPRCGEKFMAADPDSGKTVEQRKGLGKWRCSNCGKVCKVTPRKPELKEESNVSTQQQWS